LRGLQTRQERTRPQVRTRRWPSRRDPRLRTADGHGYLL